ncbi:hypothetical protein NXS19_008967 [Fusarium pseudograminearum]|nr:hypothetical protein NXS19_008967 [Fusarium pseudograminearum]
MQYQRKLFIAEPWLTYAFCQSIEAAANAERSETRQDINYYLSQLVAVSVSAAVISVPTVRSRPCEGQQIWVLYLIFGFVPVQWMPLRPG